jgi:hypothetical protein
MATKLIEEKEKAPYFTPKYVKKKAKIMQCTYEGCENTFKAFPHARFCEFHKDPSTRPTEKKVEENTMFIFKHSFKEKMIIERYCDCCNKSYRIEVYPEREEYPRFCDEHHSEYKRIFWREQHGEKC